LLTASRVAPARLSLRGAGNAVERAHLNQHGRSRAQADRSRALRLIRVRAKDGRHGHSQSYWSIVILDRLAAVG